MDSLWSLPLMKQAKKDWAGLICIVQEELTVSGRMFRILALMLILLIGIHSPHYPAMEVHCTLQATGREEKANQIYMYPQAHVEAGQKQLISEARLIQHRMKCHP